MVILYLIQGGLTLNRHVMSDPGRPARLMVVLCLTQGGFTFNVLSLTKGSQYV